MSDENGNGEVDNPTVAELAAEIGPQRQIAHPLSEDMTAEQFERANFVAFVDELRYDRKGNVVLSITVPRRYRHFVASLPNSYGIPLVFDCEPWEPYVSARDS